MERLKIRLDKTSEPKQPQLPDPNNEIKVYEPGLQGTYMGRIRTNK